MDPISDFLTRIRNAKAVSKKTVQIPYSKFKMEIAKLLKSEELILDVVKKGKKVRKTIEITLKYDEEGKSVIDELKMVSKQGRRLYKGYKELGPVKYGFGLSIISTPQGVMTDKEVRRRKLGGEVLCEIW